MKSLESVYGQGSIHVFEPHEVVPTPDTSDSRNGPSVYARALMDSLTAPSILMGWSMGGMIAMEAAAAVPSNISALVLACTSPRFCKTHDYRFGFALERVTALAESLENDIDGALREFISWTARPLVLSEQALDGLVLSARETGTSSLLQGLHYLMSCDLRTRLGDIHIPTLVLHGRQDAIVPWRGGKLLADSIPNARWERIDHCSHDFALRSPRVVTERVKAFQESLDGSNSPTTKG